MSLKKKIYFIHYHLIPGGVTTVIKHQVEVLKENFQISIITSEKMWDEELKKLNEFSDVNFLNLEYLSYQYIDSLSNKDYENIKNNIFKFLETNIEKENSILWVHNHNLGKNPSFTDAIVEYIKKYRINTIFQIHDFPECSRWENYKFLKQFLKNSMYPEFSHVSYVLINKDDYERLTNCGLNKANIFYLPNPVKLNDILNQKSFNSINIINKNSNKSDYIDDRKILDIDSFYKKVEKYSKDEGFTFKRELPIILYPVRTIRRKNILEAVLITKIFRDSINLFVTLPANSKKEREYEKLVYNAFLNGNINGIWGISKKLPELFESVGKYSKFYISTSVLEGFGLMFIEALSNKKVFFTRYINVLKDFSFIKVDFVYKKILVPIDKDLKTKYIKLYKNKINNLPIKLFYKKKLEKELEKLIENDLMDFSYFKKEDQFKIIQSNILINEIKSINKEELDKFETLINSKVTLFEKYFAENDIYSNIYSYSIDSYKEKINNIISEIFCRNIEKENGNKKVSDDDPEQNILNSFLKFEYLRLIFD